MNLPSHTSFDELLQAGLAASSTGDTDRAVALFTQAAAQAPQAAAPHFLIGSEYAAIGQVDQAEQSFARALLLEPGMAIVRYQLGLLQFSSARVPQALLTWQPLLALAEDDALLHFVRGFHSVAADDVAEALAHFSRGLPLNTQFPPVSDDIRKVMNGLQALDPHAAPSAGEPPADGASGEAAAAEVSGHLFFANYQKQGTLH